MNNPQLPERLEDAIITILARDHAAHMTYTRLHHCLALHPKRARMVLALLDLIAAGRVYAAERCDASTLGEPVTVYGTTERSAAHDPA